MCLFLPHFGLFWQFVDVNVISHRQLVCAYYALVRLFVLLLATEFRVLGVKFFLVVILSSCFSLAFLVVEFFLVLFLYSGGG
jgi:hypothetical protein